MCVCVCVCVCIYLRIIYNFLVNCSYVIIFKWVHLFNGISTFVSHLMPKPSLEKNSNDTI